MIVYNNNNNNNNNNKFYLDVACQTGNDNDDDIDENVKSYNYQRPSFSRMIIISFIMYLVFLL